MPRTAAPVFGSRESQHIGAADHARKPFVRHGQNLILQAGQPVERTERQSHFRFSVSNSRDIRSHGEHGRVNSQCLQGADPDRAIVRGIRRESEYGAGCCRFQPASVSGIKMQFGGNVYAEIIRHTGRERRQRRARSGRIHRFFAGQRIDGSRLQILRIQKIPTDHGHVRRVQRRQGDGRCGRRCSGCSGLSEHRNTCLPVRSDQRVRHGKRLPADLAGQASCVMGVSVACHAFG